MRDAEVKHLDETGFRVAGRTRWLPGLSTLEWTFCRTHPWRGSVREGLQGCLVHDHWKLYFTVPNVPHQLCNAHHLRELQALVDLDWEARAGRMQRLLLRANLAVRPARELQRELRPSLVEWIERRYAQRRSRTCG